MTTLTLMYLKCQKFEAGNQFVVRFGSKFYSLPSFGFISIMFNEVIEFSFGGDIKIYINVYIYI